MRATLTRFRVPKVVVPSKGITRYVRALIANAIGAVLFFDFQEKGSTLVEANIDLRGEPDRISRRKAQLAFDIDAALFTVTELAQVSGISRSAIDMYLHRGVLIPTRRARTLSPTRKTKVRGWKTAQGRPMFSVIIIFKARLIWELGNTLGLGPSESSLASDQALHAEIPEHELEAENVAEIAAGRNWMWTCARSVETNQTINIYAYAARSADRWLFDMQLRRERCDSVLWITSAPPLRADFGNFHQRLQGMQEDTGRDGRPGLWTHKSGRAMRSR